MHVLFACDSAHVYHQGSKITCDPTLHACRSRDPPPRIMLIVCLNLQVAIGKLGELEFNFPY